MLKEVVKTFPLKSTITKKKDCIITSAMQYCTGCSSQFNNTVKKK